MHIPTILVTDNAIAVRQLLQHLYQSLLEGQQQLETQFGPDSPAVKSIGAKTIATLDIISQLLNAIDRALEEEVTTSSTPSISCRQLSAFSNALTGIVTVNGNANITMLVDKNNLNITQP